MRRDHTMTPAHHYKDPDGDREAPQIETLGERAASKDRIAIAPELVPGQAPALLGG